jgi:hypothetical protein
MRQVAANPMMIHERFAKLRAAYPADIEKIEAEEKRVSELLKRQECSELETSQELLALCRRDIVKARIMLASDRQLTPEQQRELWQIVDAREWFVKMFAKDYAGELEQIDRELEAELSAYTD